MTACPDSCGPQDQSDDQGRDTAARHVFEVSGLCCAAEIAELKRNVGPVVGGAENLAFDTLYGRMTVLDSAEAVATDRITAAVRRTGMTAAPVQDGEPQSPPKDNRAQNIWTAVSGAGLALGIALHLGVPDGLFGGVGGFFQAHGAVTPWPAVAAYLLAVAAGGRFVVPKAVTAAQRLRPDINLLMVVAIVGAVALGEWFEAGTVAFLFALSLVLESWSVGRARRAVETLLDLAPPTARIVEMDGSERDVPADAVAVGTRIVIQPGARIPLDGIVLTGTSAVDQAPITGESVPVTKETNSEVFAGTINGDGALEVRTTKTADDTTLARIIRMVADANSRRARVEQWVERFAQVYTPAVFAAAIATAVLAPLLFGAAWTPWIYRALVLLVIACPCALVISTPVSVVAALARAARNGVLVKGGAYIEAPARLDAIAFDKTGTLTQGKPEVVAVVPAGGIDRIEVLALAAALETRSTHPLAEAIAAAARDENLALPPVTDAANDPGRGVRGRTGGAACWVGAVREIPTLEDGLAREVDQREASGETLVAVMRDDAVLGLIALADALRPDSARVIAALRELGVRKFVMLTGDNAATANAIAARAGIDTVRAGLLPDDKVAAVADLTAGGGTVAMIGDGVNDAPAMARASLGIAMGAAGSDTAIETADIALMTDDLDRLPWLIRHARRTRHVIQQNVALALGLKALFVVLALGGAATLWAAILADVGASLLVTFNGLRLLRQSDHAASGARQASRT